jgi:hypothetical protein
MTLVALLQAFSANADALRFGEKQKWLTLPPGTGGLMALGDVNGDGKTDLVVNDVGTGTVHVALSNGRTFNEPKLWATGLPHSSLDITFGIADVNGDGKADFVAFVHGNGDTDGSANVYVALSNGSNFSYTSSPVWNDGFCITEQVCALADINGDGKADLVAFTPKTGLVWASLSTGTAFGPNATWNNYFCILSEVCAVGDVDGDRKADIIAFKPNAPGVQKGNVLIAGSTGHSFEHVRYGHGFFCIDAEGCLVGDVNGDTKTDIVLVKGFGTTRPARLEVLVSLSNGQQLINATPFQWAGVYSENPQNPTYGPFMLGDVTGDGKSDLVSVESVRDPQGLLRTLISVYPVTDKRPTPPPPTNPPPPGAALRQLVIYNCDPDQHRFNYWLNVADGGNVSMVGPVDAMYSETGFCPDPNDSPQTINITQPGNYDLVVVDPQAIACDGRNDPTIVACRKHAITFRGDPSGQTFRWILSAGSP